MTNKPYAIDLYRGNTVLGNNDEGFAKVKAAGIALLDHKASQGTSEVDSMVGFRRERWVDGEPIPVTDIDGTILQLQPKFGFYHFNGGGAAAAEAAHFISVVKPIFIPGDDLCLDWEDIGASGFQQPASWANDFCNVVEDWCQFSIKVYGGDAPREQLAKSSPKLLNSFAKRRLWFCQYGVFNPTEVPLPWKTAGPDYHQDDGDQYGPGPHTIPGISGYCDNSTVVGTMTVAKLYARWGGGVVPVVA